MAKLGLSQAANNFVNAYTMGKQQKQQQQAQEKTEQVNSLLGGMLMGTATPDQSQQLAEMAPNQFLSAQNYLQSQETAKNQTAIDQENQLKEELDNQRMDFIDWEDDVFDRVRAADQENRAVVYNQLMRQGRNTFNEQFFQGTPEQYNDDIDKFISSLGETTTKELKSGRYKETIAPDGTVYQLDTATGERVKLYDGIAPEVELKAGMEARLADTQDAARKSASKAREFSAVADDFESFDVSGGGFSTAWEGLKDFTGQQDYESELRRKWMGVKASQVVDNLPPGAASDKDIEMAMSGFPPNNASPEIIASFLRGMAKLESENSKYNELEAMWISTQGNTAQSKSDFSLNGVEVKKGDTLLEVYKKMSKDSFPSEEAQNSVVITAHPTYGDVTEEDIQATMKNHNLSREEVLSRIQGAGQ